MIDNQQAFATLLRQCPAGDISAVDFATRQEARVFAKHASNVTKDYKVEMKELMLTLTGPSLRTHVLSSKRKLL
mgnify:FL=1